MHSWAIPQPHFSSLPFLAQGVMKHSLRHPQTGLGLAFTGIQCATIGWCRLTKQLPSQSTFLGLSLEPRGFRSMTPPAWGPRACERVYQARWTLYRGISLLLCTCLHLLERLRNVQVQSTPGFTWGTWSTAKGVLSLCMHMLIHHQKLWCPHRRLPTSMGRNTAHPATSAHSEVSPQFQKCAWEQRVWERLVKSLLAGLICFHSFYF